MIGELIALDEGAVIVLANQFHPDRVIDCVQAAVAGYLLVGVDQPEAVIRGIRAVRRGGASIDPLIAMQLLQLVKSYPYVDRGRGGRQ